MVSTLPSSLSTEWVDYVEEPMKYQALRPQFSLWVGGGGGVGGEWSWGGVWDDKIIFGIKKIIVSLMKDLKYEHQSIFPLLGRVKLNFKDR